MSSFRNIDVKSPHVQELQRSIQLELANRGYSSEDDPVMAEYIVVMLANQKTSDQITSELQDLIGLEYDSSFTDWIWNQTQHSLDRHYASSSTAAQASTSTGASVFDNVASSTGASFHSTDRLSERRSRSPQTTRARDQRRSRSPAPSNAWRGSEQRRARSNSPPPAPRGERMSRGENGSQAWRQSAAQRRDGEPFDGKAYWRQRAEERRRNPPPPVLNRGPSQIFQSAYGRALRNEPTVPNGNAGKELFPTSSSSQGCEQPPPPYSEVAISIFGRAGIPDPRAPAFVPSSGAALPLEGTTQLEPNEPGAAAGAPSVSILSRIDPMLPNNDPLPSSAAVGGSERNATTGHSSDFPTAPTETSICRWNLGCTNPMCSYSHASPANSGPNGDPNALVLSQQNCRYGARCSNKDCTRSHVSPAIAHIQNRVQPTLPASVSFRPPATATPTAATTTLSMDAALPTSASSRPCRFGAACTRADCFFSHPSSRILASTHTSTSNTLGSGIACRFGLGCTRPDCYFTHPPGQRASEISSARTADRLQAFAHQTTAHDEMEVIIPRTSTHAGASLANPNPPHATPTSVQLST